MRGEGKFRRIILSHSIMVDPFRDRNSTACRDDHAFLGCRITSLMLLPFDGMRKLYGLKCLEAHSKGPRDHSEIISYPPISNR